jgi:hypothetical protein
MPFDPNRRISVEIKEINRARFRHNVKLWLLATFIFVIPFVMSPILEPLGSTSLAQGLQALISSI